MSTRFPLDVPMDIDEFKRISLKAFDDYEQRMKNKSSLPDAISSLRHEKLAPSKRHRDKLDSEIWSETREKVSTKVLLVKILFIVIGLFAYSAPLLLLLNETVNGFLSEMGGIAPIIVLLIFGVAIGCWWLWSVFNAESNITKWVAGVFLFLCPTMWWAAIFALIIFAFIKMEIFDCIEDKMITKIKRKIAKSSEYQKRLRNATAKDEQANEQYANLIKNKIASLEASLAGANIEGEYEWLVHEWEKAFKENEDFMCWHKTVNSIDSRYSRSFKNLIAGGPDTKMPMFRRKEGSYWGIMYNDSETPKHYMEITVQAAAKTEKNTYDFLAQKAMQAFNDNLTNINNVWKN